MSCKTGKKKKKNKGRNAQGRREIDHELCNFSKISLLAIADNRKVVVQEGERALLYTPVQLDNY